MKLECNSLPPNSISIQQYNHLRKPTHYHRHRKIAGKPRNRNVALWIDYKDPNQKEDGTPFRFTGKERDLETGLYYYGARYLDPKTSRWLGVDPAMHQGDYIPSAPIDDEAKKRNGNLPGQGGIFNYVNMHVYHYAGNNPVKYVDPDGRTTEIDETSGKVINVIKDGSNSIIAYPYANDGTRLEGPGKYVGETLFWDSFISPDSEEIVGVIYENQSIDNEMNSLFTRAGKIGSNRTWLESRNGKKMDIKKRLPGHKGKSYHGFLYDGIYVTLREAGDMLAGMNAAQFGMDFWDFQKGAGALNKGGRGGVLHYLLLDATYGSSPYYGENYYQFRSSFYGYRKVRGY